MKPLVYIAAPLSSEGERVFNVRLRDFVVRCGFSAYLPQEDGGLFSELIKKPGSTEDDVRRVLFESDCSAIRRSSVCLILLDGRVPDEGACFELGFAYALGKRCIGFKTDSRSALRGKDNLMLDRSLKWIARTWEELERRLDTCRGEVAGE